MGPGMKNSIGSSPLAPGAKGSVWYFNLKGGRYMFKKIGITAVFVSALLFSAGVASTFARNSDCPDSCKCPDNVKCAKDCTKDKTDHCTCKH
uniref:Uncharacterized protein n=2 Tax=Kuenenia stuttgartiensis TaxID=174633 RepID=Q1PY85_KUEST|nr:unknown protein [Candidatus Kuenenia stuttgartiensis]